MNNKSAVSFPPQDKSSGFHSTLLMKAPINNNQLNAKLVV